MSGAPFGLFRFPGIENVVSANYAMSHGTHPGVCTMVVPPQNRLPNRVGTLAITFGGTVISLPDCVIDSIDFDMDPAGKKWVVRILDRRWKWRKFGRISGAYNVRITEDEIDKATEKRPRELMELCLRAMGERDFDVTRVPNDKRPEVRWDYTVPADALEQLAEATGCRIILRLNNSVVVLPAGDGAKLPKGGAVLEYEEAVNPPELPNAVVYAAPAMWQQDLELEPVGKDLDGEVKPIDELSYRPAKGWESVGDYVEFMQVVEKFPDRCAAKLARETVWRWYRVNAFETFNVLAVKQNGQLQTKKLKVTKKRHLLLTGEQLFVREFKDGTREPLRAIVYGDFYSGDESRRPKEPCKDEGVIKPAKPNEKLNVWDRGFSIDSDESLVKFREPAIKLERGLAPQVVGPGAKPDDRVVVRPRLFLRTAFFLRKFDTGEVVRWEWARRLGGRGDSKQYIFPEDDEETAKVFKLPGIPVAANWTVMKGKANDAIDNWLQENKVETFQSALYSGFVKIQLDGAIEQVRWNLSEAGFATTRASRGREDFLFGGGRHELRRRDRLEIRRRVAERREEMLQGHLEKRRGK